MTTVEEMRRYFGDDHFATRLGIRIDEANEAGAVCSLVLNETHQNSQGTTQGGAIFTLADFTFAVAANATTPGTVTQSASIQYLAPGTGPRLTATARLVEAAGRTSVYTVTVRDDAGRPVAVMTACGFTKLQFRNRLDGG